jgi:hypothetical protein
MTVHDFGAAVLMGFEGLPDDLVCLDNDGLLLPAKPRKTAFWGSKEL